MTTLIEACQLLGVSRATLVKWCRRLEITPTRHAFDYRFYVLSAEEIERIREARAQMPAVNAALRSPQPNPTAQPGRDDRSPIFAPETAEQPLSASFSRGMTASRVRTHTPPDESPTSGLLNDGLMSRTDAADRHGIPRSTLRRWCEEGRIETSPASYGGAHGTFVVRQPLTQKGLTQLVAYARVHQPHNFHTCDLCPHTAASDADGANLPISGQQ